MKIKICAIFILFLLTLISLSGCTDPKPLDPTTNSEQDQPEGCPSKEDVDALEQNFTEMRNTLSTYMNDTEYEFNRYSTTRQSGNVTEEGRQMRLDYEELRDQYLDVAFLKCLGTNNIALEGGSATWLKGYDLTEKEIHPEYFLGLPFYSKDRILYEEPDFWTGETTDYFEYQYQGENNGYNVIAKIYGEDVGTTEDQWQYEIEDRALEKVNYDYGHQPGSNVYYTNTYVDEYGRKYKGIYFQIFGFAVYAGYYGDTHQLLGSDDEFFNAVEIDEDFAKQIYEYLVYRPGHSEASQI